MEMDEELLAEFLTESNENMASYFPNYSYGEGQLRFSGPERAGENSPCR